MPISENDLGDVDETTPQTARIWNYLLGGKDNFPADRAVGDEIARSQPEWVRSARLDHKFLARVVRHLAANAGVTQFLDVGAGLPTGGSTHEVAQAVDASSRVVYVDNDPLAIKQGRALLTSTPEGATAYVAGDMREPGPVLEQAGRVLDLSRPVALLLMGVLGHVESDNEAKAIVNGFMQALPPRSCFAMYDGSDTTKALIEVTRIWNVDANPKYHLRSPQRLTRLFDGLELVSPGVVPVTSWRPDPSDDDAPTFDQYGAVGRKPEKV